MKSDIARNQHGFSMIEVLVTIVIMAFGLLGVSGLMLSGVNNATAMDLSSRATQSANEIMDAMRANAPNAASYVTAYSATPSDTSLTGTEIYKADIKQWLTALARLPGGDGSILQDATPVDGEYIIKVRFTNCLGTLTATNKTNCSANNDANLTELTFRLLTK